MLRLSAVQHTGLLDAFVTAVMEVADPTIPGLSPPNPAVVARLLLTLLFLPVAGLARIWDLRSYSGTMLAILSGRERAYSQRYTERFLARLAHAGAAERLTEVIARCTWSLWQAGSDEPHAPAVFYVDGHRKAVYSDVLVPRGPVDKLDGKILGCRELVVLHDAQAHPLLATTHRGDQHLTIGLPHMLHCYEQATGQAQVKRVVVDREGMAAEFLAQLHQEGRQVVTLLRSDQYEGEGSFEQVGAWQPWRYNRHGQLICEVASARFTLPRPNPLDSPVRLEVALIRDWRKLLVVEQADEAVAVQNWQADLALQHQHRVFAERAARGKTSVGWFFGFKLHLVVNDQGELVAFCLTPGNVDDRHPVPKLATGLVGKLFADKGYLSRPLAQQLLVTHGLHLITKLRKKMHNRLLDWSDKLLLRKRAIIETITDQLKNICQIEHSRHRSPINFLVNLVAGLLAYCHQPKKPSLGVQLPTLAEV